MMLTSTLILTALALPQEAVQDKALNSHEIAKQLKAALKEGVAPALSTILKHGSNPDKAVTAELGKACKHKDAKIRVAAIQALRFNKGEHAFSELYKQRTNKLVVKEPAIAKEYYLALGQNGDKRALSVLTRDLSSRYRKDEVLKAKVMAIGRIKDRAAIETLIKFLARSRKSSAADSANTGLFTLTGHKAKGALQWSRWWKANKRSFTFLEEPPKLSRRDARQWNDVWREPGALTAAEAERKKKRAKQAEKRKERQAAKTPGLGDKNKAADAGDAKKGDEGSGVGGGKAEETEKGEKKKGEITGERRRRLRGKRRKTK